VKTVHDLLQSAHTLELLAQRLRQDHVPEVARQVQLAVELLRKEIDLMIESYEAEQKHYERLRNDS
jgi:hypothetical protein